MPFPCPERFWCNCDRVPPLLCARLDRVFPIVTAAGVEEWMTCLNQQVIPMRLVRCDVPSGTFCWLGCTSYPPKCRKLRRRISGRAIVELCVTCPSGPADWKLRFVLFPTASNPAPELIDPPNPGPGFGAQTLVCGPPLTGFWITGRAHITVYEAPCEPLPPERTAFWHAYFSGDYWPEGYFDSTGSGPPPPSPAGYYGGYFGPDFWGPGYF